MIDYDEMKNVIDNLDKYVSSLKHITETQSALQNSNEELIEIKKELDSLINEIRHFAELTKQTEQMRTEVLKNSLVNIGDKVAILQEQFNELNLVKDNIATIKKQQLEIEIKAQRRFKTLLGAILGSAGIIFLAFLISVI